MPRTVLDAPAFEIPARKFHLFMGPLEAVEETFCTNDIRQAVSVGFMVLIESEGSKGFGQQELEDPPSVEGPPFYQSANLWWPEDRAWCVATEIDFNTTYIAGTQGLVDALLACEELEVHQVEPTDGVAYDGDALNPTPDDPYGGSFRLILR